MKKTLCILFALMMTLMFGCIESAHAESPAWAVAPRTGDERTVVSSLNLSECYPSVLTDGMCVTRNSWDAPRWSKKTDEKCRISGTYKLGDMTYLNGVGMYLPGAVFRSSRRGTEATGVVSYRLNGEFDALTFDLGPDASDMRYCGQDDGKAAIQIYADDTLVYQSELFDCDTVLPDQTADVSGADKIKIVLIEQKGSNNTLNVLMGDAQLIVYG